MPRARSAPFAEAAEAAQSPPRHALDLSAAFAPAAAAVSDGTLPSAVIGVSDGHGTRALVAYPGVHDRGVTSGSVYFLASVTKPIVATAVMQLVDEGRLDLHAPIGRYVPEWRGPGKEGVTAWHVLTHTAGIADIRQELLLRERPSYRGMLERICAADLQSAPGERYAYASDSFYLLAETISRLTGMPFGDALRRRLFEPLGMTSTTFDPRPMRSRVPPVRGVPLGNPLLRELILRFLAKATLPGGGLFGSAEDLLRLGRALLPRESGPGPRVLSQAAIEAMTTEQTAGILEIHEDGSTRDPHYALGWRKPDPRGATASSLGSAGTAGAWAGIASPKQGDADGAGAPGPTDGRDEARDAEGAQDAEAARDAETSDTIVPASPGTFHHGGASGTRLWVDPGAPARLRLPDQPVGRHRRTHVRHATRGLSRLGCGRLNLALLRALVRGSAPASGHGSIRYVAHSVAVNPRMIEALTVCASSVGSTVMMSRSPVWGVTARCASSMNATPWTCDANCICWVRTPVVASQIRAMPSEAPVAISDPSGLRAADLMFPLLASGDRPGDLERGRVEPVAAMLRRSARPPRDGASRLA